MSTPFNPEQPPQPFQQPSYSPATPPVSAYAAPAQYPQPAPQGTTLGATNTFAFLSILFAFIVPVAAVVFGHIGLSQIKRTGDAGRGIALTGLIIGYAYAFFIALMVVIYLSVIVIAIGSMGAAVSSYSTY